MKFGSVCSGIEAASVAWHPLGWRSDWFAEIEKFPAAVLANHYPQTPNLGDMTQIARQVLCGAASAPDVLVGGTPCQAFSVAGMRAGLDDPRGALTIKFVELADAIDHVRVARGDDPAIIVWENVPGVLSDRGNAFGCFLGALAGEDCELQPSGGRWTDAGCVYGPARAIAWRVLDAQYFGLAQRRRRVFVVASAHGGFDPAAVLFEREGVRRDTPPSRGTGQNPSSAATRSVALRGRDGGATAELGDDAAGCLRASSGGGDKPHILTVHGNQDPCVQDDMAFALGRNNGGENAVCVTGEITHTLKAEGFDASEDGTGRGQPIVPACYPLLEVGKRTGASTTDPRAGLGIGGDADPMFTLQAGAQHGVASASAVRRLTPVECERLQGFPDNYTLIPWRGKSAADCPDGPRYKALGNSMAVPCMRWIGLRIRQHLEQIA